MASLTGQTVSSTYDGLLKTEDNDILGASGKLITDGLGNSSGLTLSTTGDVSISGDLTVDGAILDSNGYAGDNGQILSSTGAGTDWIDLSEISGVDGSGTANYVPKWTDGDTIGNSVIYDDGTNIGIGTTDPDAKLTAGSNLNNVASFDRNFQTRNALIAGLSGTAEAKLYLHRDDVTIDVNNILGEINFSGQDGGSYVGASIKGVAAGTWGSTTAHSNLIFQTTSVGSTSPTERMRIDSSGNVGIGETNPTTKLTVENPFGGAASTSYTTTQANANLHLSAVGVPIYNHLFMGIGSAEYAWIQSQHGNSIAQDLALNPIGGNVGIGTDNPSRTLDVNGEIETTSIYSETYRSGRTDGEIYIQATTSSDFISLGTQSQSNLMRIQGNGNVGIGTSSPTVKFHTNSGVFNLVGLFESSDATAQIGLKDNTTTADGSVAVGAVGDNMVLYTGASGSERMRITSGGYLKASNTGSYSNATGAFHEIRSSQTATTVLNVTNSSTNPYVLGLGMGASPNNTTNWFIRADDTTTARFFVFSNGNVQNTNNSYGVISDIKLKENITDATPKLEDLMQVKIRNYNLIGEETKQIGVVAQELEQVFPALIDEHPDTEEQQVPQLDENGQGVLDENGDVVMTTERVDLGTTTKSVKMSVFVPMLIKAMQEQQEIINDLKSRIETLENN